ncbi:unnamed protein product, partial [Symbiodinium sp. KB8]
DEGKDALLIMPIAYTLRLTDAHHNLTALAQQAGLTAPPMPGSGFALRRPATYRGSLAMGILKVSFTLGKLCICRLCNKKSTNDPSPLASARDNNAYGGKRPRARYKNVQSEADSVRDEVRKRERELQDQVAQAPAVELRPNAFWLSAGRRLEEVIREADREAEASLPASGFQLPLKLEVPP